MNRLRKLIFRLLFVLFSLLIIFQAWNKEPTGKDFAGAEEQNFQDAELELIEERVFELQALVTLSALLSEHKDEGLQVKGTEKLSSFAEGVSKRALEKSALEGLVRLSPGRAETNQRVVFHSALFKRCTLALFLGFDNALCQEIAKQPWPAELKEEARGYCSREKQTPERVSEEEDKRRASKLLIAAYPNAYYKSCEEASWSCKLLQYLLAENEAERETLHDAMIKQNKELSAKIAVFGVIALCLIISTVVLFAIMAIGLYRGSFKARFVVNRLAPEALFEGFTLYLVWMFAASWLSKELAQRFLLGSRFASIYGVILTIATICGALVILFWVRRGFSNRREFSQALGLRLGGVRLFFRDLALGPISYLAFLPPLFGLLALYAVVLSALNLNPVDAAHPIVPALLAAKGYMLLFFVLLAVIIAPIVEEIFFRGALYGALRAHWGVAISSSFSALLFAMLHPQGALGVFPLFCLGVFLSLLREWRGNLLTPMIAHACINGVTLTLVLLLLRP